MSALMGKGIDQSVQQQPPVWLWKSWIKLCDGNKTYLKYKPSSTSDESPERTPPVFTLVFKAA
jgi:hypothetical protein